MEGREAKMEGARGRERKKRGTEEREEGETEGRGCCSTKANPVSK